MALGYIFFLTSHFGTDTAFRYILQYWNEATSLLKLKNTGQILTDAETNRNGGGGVEGRGIFVAQRLEQTPLWR